MIMARHPATPRRLTLTDADPDAMFNLTRNLVLNGVAVGGVDAAAATAATAADAATAAEDADAATAAAAATVADSAAAEAADAAATATATETTSVSMLRLDWRDFEPAVLRDLGTDLVVGADILYDPLDIPLLLNALEGLIPAAAAAAKDSGEEASAAAAAMSGEAGRQGQLFETVDGGVDNRSIENVANATVTASAETGAETSVDVLLDEIASSRRALFVTALRQPETLQKFVDAASARGFAPR